MSNPPGSCPRPSHSLPRADRLLSFDSGRFRSRYYQKHRTHDSLFCPSHAVSSIRVVPARTRPPAGCLPARPAFASHAPSRRSFAAATHTPRAPPGPACRLYRFLTASHSRPESRGMLARPRQHRSCIGDPATDPNSGILVRDSVTALPWPLCGQRLRRLRLRRVSVQPVFGSYA